MGTSRWIKLYVELIPVPKLDASKQRPFIKLVDQILAAKKSGADTTELETEIDNLVYQIYDLTDEEIKMVEGK